MGESNPSFLPWKGSVLTDRRIEHGGSFLQELPNLLAWENVGELQHSSHVCHMRMNSHTTYSGLLNKLLYLNHYYKTTIILQFASNFSTSDLGDPISLSYTRCTYVGIGLWLYHCSSVDTKWCLFFHFIDEFYISHEFTTTPHLITLQSKVILKYYWKWEWESNPRTTVLQTATLPFCHLTIILARHEGIEPSFWL